MALKHERTDRKIRNRAPRARERGKSPSSHCCSALGQHSVACTHLHHLDLHL